MSAKARIAEAFARGRAENRALLMPFLVCGYPDPDTFVDLTRAAAANGADMLEIGIPFSDPIMDGPVIQAASNAVLERGQRTADALKLIERAAGASGVPMCAMTYYNLLFRYGLQAFAQSLADVGANGAIVPDLSIEDSAEWRAACEQAGIAPVFIAAQTSTTERLRSLAAVGDGFVYAASLLGVTGLRESIDRQASALVARIRNVTELPVALGIGVSTAGQAREVAKYADGVIVGTAVVRCVAEASDPVKALGDFVAELRAAVTR